MGLSYDGVLLVACLGTPDAYGEYCGFECPRCLQTSTHAVPSLDLWRCWECDHFDSIGELVRLLIPPPTSSSAA